MENAEINRKLTNNAGLPEDDIALADGKARYDAISKNWICTIREGKGRGRGGKGRKGKGRNGKWKGGKER